MFGGSTLPDAPSSSGFQNPKRASQSPDVLKLPQATVARGQPRQRRPTFPVSPSTPRAPGYARETQIPKLLGARLGALGEGRVGSGGRGWSGRGGCFVSDKERDEEGAKKPKMMEGRNGVYRVNAACPRR